jgi:hypothetical protein
MTLISGSSTISMSRRMNPFEMTYLIGFVVAVVAGPGSTRLRIARFGAIGRRVRLA